MQCQKLPPNWIKDGEKFALISLPVRLSPDISHTELPSGLTILPNADFELPENWREWLGTIRVEEIADCCLFLLARMVSTSLGILDEEDQKLRRLVDNWYTGLTLTSKFETSDAIFRASGSCRDGRIEIRQFGPIDPPLGSIVNDRNSISINQLRHASDIAQALVTVASSPGASGARLTFGAHA